MGYFLIKLGIQIYSQNMWEIYTSRKNVKIYVEGCFIIPLKALARESTFSEVQNCGRFFESTIEIGNDNWERFD